MEKGDLTGYVIIMIVDVHTHPWNSELPKEKPILSRPATKDIKNFEDFTDRLVSNMDRLGIDVSVVVSSIDLPDEMLARMVERHPDRLIGFTYGFPSTDSELTERELGALDRGIKDFGFKGIKLLPLFQALPFDSPALRPILEKADELRVPIMLDCWPVTNGFNPVTSDSRFEGIEAYRKVTSDYHNLFRLTSSKLMDDLPNLTIIAAHCGGWAFLFPDWIGEEKLRRIYFDTAAACSEHDIKRMRMAVDLIGADKILFGSDDWIENCPCSQEVMLNAIRQLGLGEEDERKILGENAVKMLNI